MEIVCDNLLARSPLITQNKVADNIDMEIVCDSRSRCVRESKNLINSIQSSFIAGKHVKRWLYFYNCVMRYPTA